MEKLHRPNYGPAIQPLARSAFVVVPRIVLKGLYFTEDLRFNQVLSKRKAPCTFTRGLPLFVTVPRDAVQVLMLLRDLVLHYRFVQRQE